MTVPPKPRWFRFGLRTLLVLVTLAAAAMMAGLANHEWSFDALFEATMTPPN